MNVRAGLKSLQQITPPSRRASPYQQKSRNVSTQCTPVSPKQVTVSSNELLLTSQDREYLQELPELPELQKSRMQDGPLGDVSLVGVTNILIPVSTMELFYQHFDMLQQQHDELKVLVSFLWWGRPWPV